MAKWKFVLLPFLAKLGFWGAGAVALLDSSSIPVPMDAILAVYVWNDKPHFWLYCLMASAGSAIGGLIPFGLGRAGGELFLLKRVNRERFEQMRTRFEAGAAGHDDSIHAAAAYAMEGIRLCRRRLRDAGYAVYDRRFRRQNGPVAHLVAAGPQLGPGAVDVVAHHALSLLGVVFLLAVVGFGVWWMRRKRAVKPLEG